MSDSSSLGSSVAAGAATTAAFTAAQGIFKAMPYILPKAQLYVPKAYSMGGLTTMTTAAANKDSMALKALVKTKKANAQKAVAATGFKATMKQMAGALPVVSLATAATIKSAGVTTALSADNYSVLEVQYNPASINISSNGGGMLSRPPAGDAGAFQMQVSSNVMRTNFTVDLVFEDVNISDAFHLDGLNMNAQDLAQTALSFTKNTFGEGYSVQKQCDGLLSLLNFKRLKQVIFVWSDMFFHGELTSVDVRYEMFDKLGNPILAQVRLTIQQNDSTKSIKYVSDDEQWDSAFDIAFGEEQTANAIAAGQFGA